MNDDKPIRHTSGPITMDFLPARDGDTVQGWQDPPSCIIGVDYGREASFAAVMERTPDGGWILHDIVEGRALTPEERERLENGEG